MCYCFITAYSDMYSVSQKTTLMLDKRVKVAHTRLPSVGFRGWSRFLAVSLQVTFVINPAVGCHYFPPGLQLPPQPLRGLLPILLLGEQRHMGVNSLPNMVTRPASRLRFERGPFCAWVQHANHSDAISFKYQLILTIFGRNVAEWVSYQMVVYFFTSPN